MCDKYMKMPCKHCPFRTDVKPFLHPDRAYDIAVSSENRYNSFACHKTTVSVEEFGGEGSEMVATEDSCECAGFLTLRAQAGYDTPEGFVPSWEVCYTDPWEMYYAYLDEWEAKEKLISK